MRSEELGIKRDKKTEDEAGSLEITRVTPKIRQMRLKTPKIRHFWAIISSWIVGRPTQRPARLT